MKSWLLDKTLLSIVLGFRGFLLLSPRFIQRAVLRGTAGLFYRLDKRHRRFVMANLAFAFGEEFSEEQRIALTKKIFQNFMFYLADFLLSYKRDKEALRKRVRIENPEILQNALDAGKPVICVSAHYGNWEIISKTIGAFFHPIIGVGEKLYDSPSLDRMLVEYRERHNMVMVPRMGAMRGLIKGMKEGRVVGMIVDQNTESKYGILIDFFGKKARHTPSASQLARRFDAVVIPVFVTTEDYETYTVRFREPLPVIKTDDEEADILAMTQMQADVTETAIRERPDEYFWLHRRFKNQYPKIYQQS